MEVRIATINKKRKLNVRENEGAKEHSYTVGGNVNEYSYYGNQYAVSSKN
jgi:hypothetical protein